MTSDSSRRHRRAVVAIAAACMLGAGVAENVAAQVAEYRWVAPAEPTKTWTAGELEATFAVEPEIYAGEFQSAVVFDGRRQQAVVEDVATLRAPQQQLTVEAWAIIDSPLDWGGLVSAIQDNGDHERGFLLGYRGASPCFALASEGSSGLTYLTAPEGLPLGDWVHLVGTYDGKTMLLYVNGEPAAESDEQSGDVVMPASGVVALGAYHDDDENFPLSGMLHEAAIVYRAYSPTEVAQRYAAKRNRLPAPPSASAPTGDLVHGPFIEEIEGEDAWWFTWMTETPMPSRLLVGKTAGSLQTFEPEEDGLWRRVRVSGLPRDVEYQVRIEATTPGGRSVATPLQSWDALLSYPPPPAIDVASPFAEEVSEVVAAVAEQAAAEAAGDRGYALVLGGDAALAWEIAARTRMQVVIADDDAARIQATRASLAEAGVYGSRITVTRTDGASLPFGPFLFNIVTSVEAPTEPFAEVYRCLQPSGGVICLGAIDAASAAAWAASVGENDVVEPAGGESSNCWLLRRGKLPGSGEWTHAYGAADHASNSDDDLIRGELTVAWWGRPGPRPMPDRGPRNPPPVSAGGVLYVQGDRTLFGLDAYNGSILWFKQLPSMRRSNMPRDGTNMVADARRMYLALDAHCVAFDGRTGDRVEDATFHTPDLGDGEIYDWGFLAVDGDTLYGSCTPRGGGYLGDDGEWFNDFGDENVSRVVSRALFAYDIPTRELLWTYRQGVVMNSTLVLSGGRLHFVESRGAAALASDSGRMFDEVQQDQQLVALDAATGDAQWERRFDFSKCEFMTYQVAAGDKLVVAGTDREKEFHVYAFNAADGGDAWDDQTTTRKVHHSGQLAHPTVVGDKVYFNKLTYDLDSGVVLGEDEFDWHGCGVMSASRHKIFQRFEFHGMQDVATGERTEFQGIRSGCWLSIIPSGGLVLAPETSAGCSCAHAIQTSLGYVPRHLWNGLEPELAPAP